MMFVDGRPRGMACARGDCHAPTGNSTGAVIGGQIPRIPHGPGSLVWATDQHNQFDRAVEGTPRMSMHTTGRARRYSGWLPFLLALAAIAALATAGVGWVRTIYGAHPGPVTSAPARNVGTVPSTGPTTRTTLALITPDHIEIPKLGVRAPIVDVGTGAAGELDVPLNPKTVGWWSAGARPGASRGTAILAGHINYSGVEGALAHIGSLNPGDTVYVDGRYHGRASRLGFHITGVRTYTKQALPYQQVFDQNSVGRLALVTCGGPFDAATGNYLDNIVAYAVPA
jgi:hypothetical protein